MLLHSEANKFMFVVQISRIQLISLKAGWHSLLARWCHLQFTARYTPSIAWWRPHALRSPHEPRLVGVCSDALVFAMALSSHFPDRNTSNRYLSQNRMSLLFDKAMQLPSVQKKKCGVYSSLNCYLLINSSKGFKLKQKSIFACKSAVVIRQFRYCKFFYRS